MIILDVTTIVTEKSMRYVSQSRMVLEKGIKRKFNANEQMESTVMGGLCKPIDINTGVLENSLIKTQINCSKNNKTKDWTVH